MEKISVIIPALNEETTIGQVIQSMSRQSSVGEIIVVDDGSHDQTSAVATSNGAKVVKHTTSQGNGAAVKSGLRTAQGEWVLILDADGQHAIEDVQKILERPMDLDLVVGARPFRWTRFRDFGNKFLCMVASYLTRTKIPDLTSGLRRINRKKVLLFLDIYPQGFSFPSTSTILFLASYFSVDFVPIPNRPRPGHASKSKLHPFRDGFKFITIIYRLVMLSYPLRFFIPVGVTSLIFGLAWVFRTLSLTRQVSAAGILCLLAGLIFVFFGIIADQLAQIRRSLSYLRG